MTEEVAVEPVPGVRVRWDPEALAAQTSAGWQLEAGSGSGGGTLRVLTVAGTEGGLLLVAGVRSPDGDGHDSERLAALVGGPEGPLHPAEEVLVSTEYTADGRVRRIGLEIYMPGEDYPLRGAGHAKGTAGSASDAPGSTVLDFRFDGQPATARLDLTSLGA